MPEFYVYLDTIVIDIPGYHSSRLPGYHSSRLPGYRSSMYTWIPQLDVYLDTIVYVYLDTIVYVYLDTIGLCIPGYHSAMYSWILQFYVYLDTIVLCIPGYLSSQHTWITQFLAYLDLDTTVLFIPGGSRPIYWPCNIKSTKVIYSLFLIYKIIQDQIFISNRASLGSSFV